MRFTFTKEQEEFRQEVVDFLQAEIKAGTFETRCGDIAGESDRSFSRKMAEKGWLGLTWPREYGGQGRSYVDKILMNEELFRFRAPIGFHFMAERQVGPALIKFGSDWQKVFFIPRIINAETDGSFYLLFSEPNAGSDMAAAATKAEKDGDDYILNGQKVWTTMGHCSAYGWMLARTNPDPSVPGHLACSEIIVDMASPGITIRPILNILGDHSFNEVFFDNVRVPKKYLVGQENAGFKQIMAQMDYERAGIERLTQNYMIYEQLKDYARAMDSSERNSAFHAQTRDAMAQLEVEYQAGRLLCYYTGWCLDQHKNVSSHAALTKAFCTQFEQRLDDVAMQILGPISLIRERAEGIQFPFIVDLADSYLWQVSYTLQGGTVEILKNIVAQRGLGLPRK